jgi:para-nitrobenzyl esterase
VDDYVLPDNPYNIFVSGEQRKVPLLAGWNSLESFGYPDPTSMKAFKNHLHERFPERHTDALKFYPAVIYREANISAIKLLSD